jgi:hypothetical protein
MNGQQPVANLANERDDENLHARQPDDTDHSWVDDPEVQKRWEQVGLALNMLHLRGIA